MYTRTRKKAAMPEHITFVDQLDDTTCSVCYAEFLDEEDLRIHQTQMHLNEAARDTVCKICAAIFPCGVELVMHLIYNHLENLNFCFYCYRGFVDKLSQEQHSSRHSTMQDESLVTCSQCPLTFVSRRKLQKHEYVSHKDSEDGVMLNSVFSLLSSGLNIQITKFLDSVCKKKSFKCNMCEYFSRDVSDYVNHLKGTNCISFACDKCFNVYRSKIGIRTHLMKQSKYCNVEEDDRVQCVKCDKYFDVKDVREHEKSCEAVKCFTCKEIFTIHNLAEHRIKEHSASLLVSVQPCKFCNKEFVGAYNLKKHINRAHKNMALYKYPCTHCGTLYNHPSKLFAHFFTKHKSIEPYMCKICNKKFKLRRKFTYHIKMEHKSVGFVEFDKNLHVIFIDKKSENSYRPHTPEYISELSQEDDNTEPRIDGATEPDAKSNSKTAPQAIELPSKSDNSSTVSALNNINSKDSKHAKSIHIKESNELDATDTNSTDVNSQDSDNMSLLKALTKIDVDEFDETLIDVKTCELDDMKLKSSDLYDSEETADAFTADIYDSEETLDAFKDINSDDSDEVSLLKVREGLMKSKTETRQQQLDKMVRRRRGRKSSKKENKDCSDEEPLCNIRDTIKNAQSSRKSTPKHRRKAAKFTCNICDKYCYTFQNYHHHMTLHEKNKLKRCIKCKEYFKSKAELTDHIAAAHSTSKLTETLKKLLEKRKKTIPDGKFTTPSARPAETLKTVLEQRKKDIMNNIHNTVANKFRKTIKKVETTDDCSATITPITDHGISLKSFVEHFKADGDAVNISNCVTIKSVTEPMTRKPGITLRKFCDDVISADTKLRFPVRFKEIPTEDDGKVSVRLVQQLITKPKAINISLNEKAPAASPQMKSEADNEYCNMFADDTDYSQYKNEAVIPEVAHEVMLSADDVPKTRQLAQEIIIPNIPEEYGGVRIGHLHPDAPFYKIVEVKKLLTSKREIESDDETEIQLKLPDGTQLVTVKNPFSHLIPNNHLEEILKANKNKYYTPKVKNIERALAKALNHLRSPPKKRSAKKV